MLKSNSILTFILITWLCLISSSQASSQNQEELIPDWMLNLYQACTEKKSAPECQTQIENLLTTNSLWGNVQSDFLKGAKAWPNDKLQIRLSKQKKKEGEFVIKFKGKKMFPEITLSMAYSVPEMLITLSHEITHFANSENLIKEITNRKVLLKSCINSYKLSVLKDENHAFRSEVEFWNKAPAWFKSLFNGVKFNSIFSEIKQTSFEENYKFLEKVLTEDPLYGSKRYIKLGQYPKCATSLLD